MAAADFSEKGGEVQGEVWELTAVVVGFNLVRFSGDLGVES